jgi:hypothetical protein
MTITVALWLTNSTQTNLSICARVGVGGGLLCVTQFTSVSILRVEGEKQRKCVQSNVRIALIAVRALSFQAEVSNKN